MELSYRHNGLEVREATEADEISLAGRLRPTDMREVWASHHLTPYEALHFSRHISKQTFAGCIDGNLIAMFGYAVDPADPKAANIWLLGSAEISTRRRDLLSLTRLFVEALLCEFEVLYNYVDERNFPSIAWLAHCGAKIAEPKPFGAEGLPFCYFSFRRK